MGSIFSGNAQKKAAQVQANAQTQAAETQALASREAAGIQAEASDRAVQAQREQNALARSDFFDARDSGLRSLEEGYTASLNYLTPLLEGTDDARQAILYENGIGQAPSGYEGIQSTPGFDFLQSEGRKDIMSQAAAMGSLNSGAVLRSLSEFQTGLDAQNYQAGYNRLAGVSNQGIATRNALAGLTTDYTGNRANVTLGNATNIAGTRFNEGNAAAQGAYYSGNAAAQGVLGAGNATAQGTIGSANARAQGIIAGGNIFGNTINELLGYGGAALGAYGSLSGASSFGGANNVLAPGAGIGAVY